LDWVHAVERAYVAAATKQHPPQGGTDVARARAAVGAIASHYLAVGTPRTLGIIAGQDLDEAELSIAAHRTWFQPREIRWMDRDATLAETLACDIVCVYAPIEIRAAQLRRGTHVNVLGRATIDDDLRRLATVCEERQLGALAAGLVDGRQLDELTVFVAGDLLVALGALHGLS
jgi:hypothetical protein